MTARPRLTDAGADGASGGEPSGPPPRMQVRLESGKLIGSWCTAVPAARDPQRHYSECGKNLPKKWCAERPMSTEGADLPPLRDGGSGTYGAVAADTGGGGGGEPHAAEGRGKCAEAGSEEDTEEAADRVGPGAGDALLAAGGTGTDRSAATTGRRGGRLSPKEEDIDKRQMDCAGKRRRRDGWDESADNGMAWLGFMQLRRDFLRRKPEPVQLLLRFETE